METLKIKREIVAAFMQSPLYFTIPPDKRLEIIKFFSHPTAYNLGGLTQSDLSRDCDLKLALLH
jgi:hypothetical protein